jgi:hypothetical protein
MGQLTNQYCKKRRVSTKALECQHCPFSLVGQVNHKPCISKSCPTKSLFNLFFYHRSKVSLLKTTSGFFVIPLFSCLVDGVGEGESPAHAPRFPYRLGIHGTVWGFGLTFGLLVKNILLWKNIRLILPFSFKLRDAVTVRFALTIQLFWTIYCTSML